MSDIGDYRMGGPRRPLVDREASLVRAGQRFLHKRQLRTDVPYSELKNGKPEEIAQLMEITAVRSGRVYYAPIYQSATGGEYRGKTTDYMPLERFESYAVLKYLPSTS